jgi:hypothetical protein
MNPRPNSRKCVLLTRKASWVIEAICLIIHSLFPFMEDSFHQMQILQSPRPVHPIRDSRRLLDADAFFVCPLFCESQAEAADTLGMRRSKSGGMGCHNCFRTRPFINLSSRVTVLHALARRKNHRGIYQRGTSGSWR